jgi:hypothetical protein
MTARSARMNNAMRTANQFSAWRKQGIPSVITADEAWRLTEGAFGKEGDHGTPVNLAAAAVAVVKRRKK